ncbi:glycoside hydrolase family 28 protein [Thiotrichales bacterium 19S3-7]|nr:glycoside hydrolase family 28 protein [Thiotrichales bacterium 19S3-7]MCF6801017.1 glycoside hydrolase family 28 protein [Thiotrichales bacterium 19S3-11]
MKQKNTVIMMLALFIVFVSSQAFAAIKVDCQKKSDTTWCDFSGNGDDLSETIIDKIKEYKNNLVINILPGHYSFKPIEIRYRNNITINLNKNTKLIGIKKGDPSLKGVKAFISIRSAKNIVLSGAGSDVSIFDGQGASWWKVSSGKRPEFTYFKDIDGLKINGIGFHNSPKYNIELDHVKNVEINDIVVQTSKDSPNTDGIIMTTASDVKINHIEVTNGDDCVAINADLGNGGASKNIKVTNATCNYGHGISFGSNIHNTIENVVVDGVTFNQSNNGLRIKSHCEKENCSDTKNSLVKAITYKNISMNGVKRPIVFQLSYKNVNNQFSLVKIKDITYDTIYARNSDKPALFICEEPNACSQIRINSVSIDTGGLCQGINGSDPSNTTEDCPFKL